MAARTRAAGWNWTAPNGPISNKKRSRLGSRIIMSLLALAVISAAGMLSPVVAQTQTPQRQVEVLPPQQIPPVLDEDGLLIVDQFGATVKPDEPYRAPAPRPPAPGPAATYDVVLYNSRLILLETPSGGAWSRGVTYKRV